MRDDSRPHLLRILVPAAAVVLLFVLVPLAAAVPPTANDDLNYVVIEDSTGLDLNVLANDLPGTTGDTLVVATFTQPTNGLVTENPDETLKYVPNANFNGDDDTFTYTAENQLSEPSGQATVSVDVTAVNDAPVVVNDSLTVTAAGATFDVRTNDSPGPNESAQTLVPPTLVTPPPSGTAVVNGSGTITYTPAATFAGNVVFTYQVCDDATPTPLCATGTVTLEVLPTLAASDAMVVEGDSGTSLAVVDVALNAAFGKTVSVAYATAAGSAMSGADFQATSGTLTFAPGESVKNVAVNVVGDSSIESDETFFLDLSAPTNATIADARGAATIRNDDSQGCDITGTAGADQLTGTAGSETICGLGGNDRITGGGGDDIVIGGPGNDTIDAGAGGDTVTGGAGNDRVAGGAGDDAIDGDAGNDTIAGDGGGDAIEGGAGVDTIRGGVDSDSIDGGDGNDVARGNAGDDIVDGHAGNDRLSGDAGDDRVDGGAGSDHVSGGAGNDWVNGGAGNETGGRAGIFGGAGNDTVRGEGGDNAFFPGAGNDLVQGGGRRDVVRYSSASSGVVVDLTRKRATGEGRDRLTGVEDVTGSRFADTLLGNSLANRLEGGAGNDRLFGRGGNDTLVGGAGRDALNGEAGNDSCAVGPGGGTTSSC